MKIIIVFVTLFLLNIGTIFSLDFKSVGEAVEADDYEGFVRFFKTSADYNAQNELKIPVLQWISTIAKPKYLKFLIDHGAKLTKFTTDISLRIGNWDYFSPIMITAWGGNLEGLKFYESIGQDINEVNDPKSIVPDNCLSIAIRENRFEIVKYLYPKIKSKFSPLVNIPPLSRTVDDIIDFGYSSYLETAIGSGRTDIGIYLIELGFPIVNKNNYYGWSILQYSLRNQDPRLFKLLLSKNLDWNSQGGQPPAPIFAAVRDSHIYAKPLLDRGVKLDVYDKKYNVDLLQAAVKVGNIFTTQLLLGAKLDPNKKNAINGLSAIEYANQNDRKWMVPILTGKTVVAYPNWTLDDEIATGIHFQYQYSGDLSFKSVGGQDTKLSNFWGTKVILLNRWATWCPPCVVEMPSLQAFYDKNKSKGLEVLTETVDEDPQVAVDFMKKYKLSFPLFTSTYKYVNGTGDTATNIQPYPTLGGVPATHLIDKNGMLVTVFQGSQDWSSPAIQKFMDVVMSIRKWY